MEISSTATVRAASVAPRPNQEVGKTSQIDQVQRVLEKLEVARIIRGAVELRERIKSLQTSFAPSVTSQVQTGFAVAKSSVDFRLGDTPTAATLRSGAEVNLETSNVTPHAASWEGISDAQPTLSGVYTGLDDGVDETGDLTFTVTRRFERGVRNGRVLVTDPLGADIVELRIRKGHQANHVYDIGNGLSIVFDGDNLDRWDTFTVAVEENVAQAPDLDTPFNADPNFQTGLSISAGEFVINGATISVAADDTLNTVLDKINLSAANVTATYDSAGDTILLTQKSVGSEPSITLGLDTSGFFAATKLDSAITVSGTQGDATSPLARTDAFSSVSAGALQINGVSIDLDPNSDSLNDVLASINASSAGVNARLIRGSFVVINATDMQTLDLDSNGTGFFEALNVSPGEHRGQQGQRVSYTALNRSFEGLDDVFSSLNMLFDAPAYAPENNRLKAFREQTAEMLSAALGDLKQRGIDIGLRLDTQFSAFDAKFNDASGQTFRRGAGANFAEVRAAFTGSSATGKDGLLVALLDALQERLMTDYSSGAIVDTYS